MTIQFLYRFILLTCLYSCSIQSDSQGNNTENVVNRTGKKQFGIYIENGPRQGMEYFDSSKTEYNYRYFTITLMNDSIVPIHLNIGFARPNMRLSDTLQSTIFLLPRHLTPNEQHFDVGGMPAELKTFLDSGIKLPLQLNKTLNQHERCVMTFGVISPRDQFDPTTPFDTELLTSLKNSSEISVMLKLSEYLSIPCGSISYVIK